jgi:hypothetical protein
MVPWEVPNFNRAENDICLRGNSRAVLFGRKLDNQPRLSLIQRKTKEYERKMVLCM